MKKILFGLLLFISSSFLFSNELWNGINIGMNIQQASRVLSERTGTINQTTASHNQTGWRNSNLLHGTQNNMKGNYKVLAFRTYNRTYYQSRHDSDNNILLYYNQNNIIIGIRVYWNISQSELLQNTINNFGRENRVVENRGYSNTILYYRIWETNNRIIQLGGSYQGTGEMLFLDKAWYNANTY